MRFFLQTLVDGLSIGSLYALFALGVALIFGIMRLINFAHGELIMCGAYAAVLIVHPLVLVAIVVPVVCIVVALVIERMAFRPVRDASPTTLLVTSFAVSYGLQNAATVVFGSAERSADVAPMLSSSTNVVGLTVPVLDLATILVTSLLLVSLALFLSRTTMGIQMRASAEDFSTARMLGVRADRVIGVAFGISGLFAGIAAILLVSQTGTVTATIGTAPVLAAFIATVVGGTGALRGAVTGGYLLGFVFVLLHAYLPLEVRPFQTALAYAVVIVLLLIRPQGLLPGPSGLAERAG